MEKFETRRGNHMVQNNCNYQKVIKVKRISENYDIITIEGKLRALIVNNTKVNLETTPKIRE